MPNHITNILDVTGPKELVTEFLNKVYRLSSKAKGEDEDGQPIFDFNATVPMPESMHITCPAHTADEKRIYAENTAKYGAGDWYEWACKFWGTKWGAYSAEAPEDIDEGLRFRFDTAWSPPSQWIETTAKQFPQLIFRDRWVDEGGGAGDLQSHTVTGETETIQDDLSEHDWRYEFDSTYAEEYDLVTSGSYEDIIEKYITKEEDFEYSAFQIPFVNRLEKKDLLLVAGLESLYDDARNRVEERLKEVETVKKTLRKKKGNIS